MKRLIAFDLDGTLAESKQPIGQETAELLAKLLDLVGVAVISGGDWPQFEAQVVSRLPIRADVRQLFIMPTTGTKLYRFTDAWKPVYADVFDPDERRRILQAFELAPWEVGLPDERTWGERIEDPGARLLSLDLDRRRRSTQRKRGIPTSPSARHCRQRFDHDCPSCPSTWGDQPPSTSLAKASTRLMECAVFPRNPAFRSRLCCSWETRSIPVATMIPFAQPEST